MNYKDLSNITNGELLTEVKKLRSMYITSCVIFGVLIGTAVYSTVKNGWGFFSFFPLFFAPMGALSRINYKAVETEIQRRNLK